MTEYTREVWQSTGEKDDRTQEKDERVPERRMIQHNHIKRPYGPVAFPLASLIGLEVLLRGKTQDMF